MGNENSANLTKAEFEELKKKAERLQEEKENEMKLSYRKEITLLTVENERLQQKITRIKEDKEETAIKYNEKIKELECKLKELTDKMLVMVQEDQKKYEELLHMHKAEILKQEASYRKIIEQKDEELANTRIMTIEIQKKGEERLDNHLNKHSAFISRLQEENVKKEKTIDDIRLSQLELLKNLSIEKDRRLEDNKTYQKSLEESISSKRAIVQHTFVAEFDENGGLNGPDDFIAAINENISATMEKNGIKLTKSST